MLINNTIESSKRPGIPGQHRPDLKWYKDALDGKSDVGHVHTKKEIEDFEHNHDGRYYRKDLNELDVILSGNGTPNFNQGDDGDYYIDELNEDMYVKEGDAWRLLIHLKGDKGDPGIDGIDGIDGYSPIRGVDYWTEEDQNKIVSEVESTIKDKRDELDQHAEELKEEISEDLTALTDSKVKELEDATAGLIEEVTSLELQERVAELEKENQEQQEEIDALYGDLEDGEASGEVVTISDGVPKTKVEVDGDGNSYQETIAEEVGTTVVNKSIHLTDVNTAKESKLAPNGGIEQDTREGYNLLNWELPVSVTESGNIVLDNIPQLEVGENYYFIGECSDGTKLNSSNCSCVWSSKEQILNVAPYKTFTGIDISSATTFYIYVTNAVAGKTITEFMLKKGTYDSTNIPSYEKYGSMPSIAFPSEVKGVGSEKEINLVDLSNPEGIGAETDFVFAADVLTISTAGGSNQDVNYDITNVYLSNPGKILKFQKEKMTQTASGFDVKLMIRDAQFNDTYVSLKDATHTIPTDVSNVFNVYLMIYATTETSAANTVVLTKPMLCFYDGTDKIYTPYSRCKYDITVENNNIYHANIGVENGYLDTLNGEIIKGAGWKVTEFIPIPESVNTITILNGWAKSEGHCFYDEDKQFILSRSVSSNTNGNLKIPLPENAKYARFTVSEVYKEDFMIAFGDTDIFVEHQSQSLSIDIPVGQVWYSGKPYKENGKWYRDIEYKKEYLSGKLNGRVPTSNSSKYSISFNLDNARRGTSTELYTGFSNLLKATTIDNIYNHFKEGIAPAIKTNDYYGTGGIFYLEETSQMTLEEVNAYITEKGMYVVYPLATPIREEITDTTLIEQLEELQKAELYEGVTNINTYSSSENIADLPIEAHYNFVTPSPSVERPSDIEVIDTVNKINMSAKTQTLNGLTLTIKEDNSFTVTGTLLANKGATFTLGKVDYMPYFDKEMTLDIGYVITSSNNIGAMVSHGYDNNNNRIATNFWNIDNNNKVGYATGTKKSESYDTSNGFIVTFTLYFPSITEDTPINISGHLQLNEGRKKPYLPYGHIGLLQKNKNIWEPTLVNNGINILNTRCTVELNEDEYIFTATGTDMYFGNIVIAGNPYISSVGTLYEVKNKKTIVINPTNPELGTIFITSYDENRISLGHVSVKAGQIYTLLTSAKYFSYRIGKNDSVAGTVYKTKIQLEYDVATEYETPKENLIPIDLQGNTLAKVGDTKDLLNIGLDGSVSIEKNIVNIITQLEAQAFDNDLGYRLYRGITEDTQGTQVLSNKFKYNANAGNGSDFGLRINSSLKALVGLAPNLSIGDTVETEVYLQKAKADTINLPSISPIKLFEGTNNFELVTNLDTTLTVHYKVSNKKQIIENNNRITALEATVTTLLGGN